MELEKRVKLLLNAFPSIVWHNIGIKKRLEWGPYKKYKEYPLLSIHMYIFFFIYLFISLFVSLSLSHQHCILCPIHIV